MTIPKKRLTKKADVVSSWSSIRRDELVWLYNNGSLHLQHPVRITSALDETIAWGDPELLDTGKTEPIKIWRSSTTDARVGWQIARL